MEKIMEKKIQEKIGFLEEEAKRFQKERQDKVNEYMRQTGIQDYIQETNVLLAEMQGKIASLREVLSEFYATVEIVEKVEEEAEEIKVK